MNRAWAYYTRAHAQSTITPPRLTSRHVGRIDAAHPRGAGEEGRKKDRAGRKGVTRTGPPPGQQHTHATPVGLVHRPRRASNGCPFKNLRK